MDIGVNMGGTTRPASRPWDRGAFLLSDQDAWGAEKMTELIFDKWAKLYSERTSLIRSSEIRDLLSVTARPDIISFAGGLPDTRSFPLERMVEATRRVMRREGSAALQYGPSEGHQGLKEIITTLMREDGMDVDTEEILITDGAQQGLELIGKIFIDRDDEIIVEAPSYVGGLQAFSSHQAKIISVALDEDGLQVDLLEETLEKLKGEGHVPKFLYVVPTFHNPAGVTLSAKRRQRLLELTHENNLLIVEDDPYSRLRFEGQPVRPLRSMDESVVYLGTFSKIFCPGLRLGWVAAPRPIIEKLIFAKQAADLCTSSLAQRLVEEYFTSYPWKTHLRELVKAYKGRRDAMLESLEEFFPPEARWTKPGGGLFLWATLPDYIDTTEMLAEAIDEEKVAYVPGRAFFHDGSGKNCMRLNFSYPEEQQIREGIKRLAKVVRRQMELYKTFAKRVHLNSGDSNEKDPD